MDPAGNIHLQKLETEFEGVNIHHVNNSTTDTSSSIQNNSLLRPGKFTSPQTLTFPEPKPKPEYVSGFFHSSGFNLNTAYNIKLGTHILCFFDRDENGVLQFYSISFVEDYSRYEVEIHKIGMGNFKDYMFLRNEKKPKQVK
jgi:hypothetical protein